MTVPSQTLDMFRVGDLWCLKSVDDLMLLVTEIRSSGMVGLYTITCLSSVDGRMVSYSSRFLQSMAKYGSAELVSR